MTKVKIFISNDCRELEVAINQFIEDKKVIDIKYTSVVYTTEWYLNGTPKTTEIGDRALIIYKE